MKRRILYVFLISCGICSSACITLGPNPKDIQRAETFYSIGVRQANDGQHRQALASLMKAQELHPNNYWIQEAIGGVFMQIGRPKTAIIHYRKALSIEPKSPRGWNNIGTAYMAIGQWQQAIKAFHIALDNVLYQTPCFARINIGWAYHKIGDSKRSQQYFNQTKMACRRYCQGHRLSGLAAFEDKKYKIALESFKQLTTLCEDYAEGYYWLARSLFELKDYQQAISNLRRCLKLSRPQSELQQHCTNYLLKAEQSWTASYGQKAKQP
jgi:tetratricopeptide (TPR) repeat protein